MDLIYDVGRIENVHWNPWWSMQKDLFAWQMNNGIGFVFGKTDWHYVVNTFCFGYHIGYQFIDTKSGSTNGNFLGIGADDCQTALVVEQCAPMGILITNGEFVSFHGPDPTMIRVNATNKGTIRFSNCAFWGPCNRIAVIGGKGTIGFSDCTFMEWGHQMAGAYAIEATGGTILVRGCEFKEDKPQILLAGKLERAVITDNVYIGRKRIAKKAGKIKAAISNNVGMNR